MAWRRRDLVGLALVSPLAMGLVPRIAWGAGIDAAALAKIVDGGQRSAKNKARDRYRHPVDTLRFLGVPPTATVVEIVPGGGWWMEILAPYLKDRGTYYAALPPAGTDPASEGAKMRQVVQVKMASDAADFGKVRVAALDAADLAPGSADFVLTFRNLHNFINDGSADRLLAAWYRVLKPGGVFGIEDHRGDPSKPQDPKAESGYVRQDYARALIEKAGFKFVAASELYANPRDTKDYPKGVWTLPPTLTLKDRDRAKYLAIGEADNFLMKFIKPA